MADHRRPPLVIRPRPSPRLGAFVVLIHLAAAAVVLPLPLARAWQGLLLLSLLTSLGWVLWARVLGRAPWSIREAVWDELGWRLRRTDGRELEARLAPSTYVGVGLVILSLRHGRLGRTSLVLMADAIEADLLRRLRVRLRLQGPLDPGAVDGRPADKDDAAGGRSAA